MPFASPFLDVDGAVVVVTGASSGIGRATAHRLASRGASLVLAARGADALEETAAQCRDAGGEAHVVVTDVSNREAVTALASAAEARFGRIDAWINNAGVMAYGRFDEVPVDAHRKVIETNLLGSVYGAAEAIERFRAQGKGLLVNVSSLYGEMTTPFVSAYVTSKFGLLGLSRVLRRDYRPEEGIAISCVLPSSMDTPIFRTAANYHGRATRAIPPVADPERVARTIERCFHRPRNEVRVGYFGRFFALGEAMVPPLYDRVINHAFRILGFTDEDVAPHDGNLFEPTRDWQQVEGEWRNTAGRRVVLAGVALAAGGVAAGGVAAARARPR